ncbi:uncharacterized protein LOC144270649 isoform X5 [Eretmochelys imbricata]
MATELEPPASGAAPLEAEEDEEHWLYGDDTTGKQEDGPIAGHAESSHPLQDAPQESRPVTSEDREMSQHAPPSGEDEEEDSDSDSDDDDDVKVTIGNIKTGAPSYMGTPMNLNLKTGRGYGTSSSAKLQPKGIDLDATGNINGLPVIEVDLDSFEDKPWRKPGADLSDYFNYGFNEETWKAYCEKQRRLQLGLDPSPPISSENKITVQQGRTGNSEKEPENNIIKTEFKTDFVALIGGRMKAGPPPNRFLEIMEISHNPHSSPSNHHSRSSHLSNSRLYHQQVPHLPQLLGHPHHTFSTLPLQLLLSHLLCILQACHHQVPFQGCSLHLWLLHQLFSFQHLMARSSIFTLPLAFSRLTNFLNFGVAAAGHHGKKEGGSVTRGRGDCQGFWPDPVPHFLSPSSRQDLPLCPASPCYQIPHPPSTQGNGGKQQQRSGDLLLDWRPANLPATITGSLHHLDTALQILVSSATLLFPRLTRPG